MILYGILLGPGDFEEFRLPIISEISSVEVG